MEDKNKKVVEIYDDIAEEYAKVYDPIDSEEDMVFPRTFLKYLKAGSLIFDIGCGTGFSSGWFEKNGMKAEGIDLSSNMIQIAKRNYPTISFSVEDMRTYRPTHEFDAVWAGYSLFHMSQFDLEMSLETIKSYLKKGGVFGLVMQEGKGEIEIPEPFRPNKTTYIHLYTVDELSKILERHGFEVMTHMLKEQLYEKEFNFSKLLVIATLP